MLPGMPAARAAGEADVVSAFVARQDDLPSAELAIAAARTGRLAWIGYRRAASSAPA
jgi:hypothetical protein